MLSARLLPEKVFWVSMGYWAGGDGVQRGKLISVQQSKFWTGLDRVRVGGGCDMVGRVGDTSPPGH